MILHEMAVDGDYTTTAYIIDLDPKWVWKKKFFFLPKRTIGGKLRMGYLYERRQYFRAPPDIRYYATAKEYFVWKLKNNA